MLESHACKASNACKSILQSKQCLQVMHASLAFKSCFQVLLVSIACKSFLKVMLANHAFKASLAYKAYKTVLLASHACKSCLPHSFAGSTTGSDTDFPGSSGSIGNKLNNKVDCFSDQLRLILILFMICVVLPALF